MTGGSSRSQTFTFRGGKIARKILHEVGICRSGDRTITGAEEDSLLLRLLFKTIRYIVIIMDDSSPLDGFSSLLRLSGNTVPARARFVGEATFSGIFTATTMGLLCGQAGMALTPFGPLVPFLCGSGLGFCLGLYATWNKAVRNVKTYAKSYPQILAHALWTENRIIVPPSILCNKQNAGHEMEKWVQDQGMRHFSLCVIAAQSCQADVEEVEKQERQRLIESTLASSLASNAEEEQ